MSFGDGFRVLRGCGTGDEGPGVGFDGSGRWLLSLGFRVSAQMHLTSAFRRKVCPKGFKLRHSVNGTCLKRNEEYHGAASSPEMELLATVIGKALVSFFKDLQEAPSALVQTLNPEP